MNSQDVFLREVKNIRKWYYSTVYSYKYANKYINEKYSIDERKSRQEYIYYKDIKEEKYKMHRSYMELQSRYDKKYKNYLSELALVRTISALEVYLIDNISEIFLINKEPFLNNNVISVHQSEIISNDFSYLLSKIIGKITSDLHRQGFNELKKYYKKTFDINFNDVQVKIEDKIYSTKEIEHMHEMRHLIVHRLGATDEKYRTKFEVKRKKINIEEDELLNFFEYIIEFSEYINKKLTDKYIEIERKTKKNLDDIIERKITVEILDNTIEFIIEPKYNFSAKEKVYLLQDILHSIQYNADNTITLNLKGNKEVVKKYVNYIRKQARKEKLSLKMSKFEDRKVLTKDMLNMKNISLDDIENVKKELEKIQCNKNRHKEIATILGMSNKKVSKIMLYLSLDK